MARSDAVRGISSQYPDIAGLLQLLQGEIPMNWSLTMTAFVLLGVLTDANLGGQELGVPPPEMKVLEKLVGTWEVEQTVKVPEESRSTKLLVKRGVVLGGRFVHEEGGFNDKGKPSFIGMYTYDSSKKAYRYWLFVSEGGYSESTGTWDERSQTLSFTNRPSWGGTGVITLRLPDEASFAFSIISKNPSGTVVYHLEGKGVRQK
jgi:hypothetical protein